MKINKVEFVGTVALTGVEERERYTTTDPTLAPAHLPVEAKAGVDVHLVLGGDWVLLLERLPEQKGPVHREPAAKLVPRERVKALSITPKQAAEVLKGFDR